MGNFVVSMTNPEMRYDIKTWLISPRNPCNKTEGFRLIMGNFMNWHQELLVKVKVGWDGQ